jgi:prepilin-type N-terminal cleavage/methylation domain-containing protein
MTKSNKAFSLVELIVVITILAVLATLWFLSYQWESQNATNSKILYDVRNLTSAIEIKLSRWEEISDLVLNNRMLENWVNTWATINSWAYILWNLEYSVWYPDYQKLKINWDDFKYIENWEEKEYIYAYIKTPKKLYYEFAWEIKQLDWKYQAVIKWNYFSKISTDAKWLVSEKLYDTWLENNQILTGSLY